MYMYHNCHTCLVVYAGLKVEQETIIEQYCLGVFNINFLYNMTVIDNDSFLYKPKQFFVNSADLTQ